MTRRITFLAAFFASCAALAGCPRSNGVDAADVSVDAAVPDAVPDVLVSDGADLARDDAAPDAGGPSGIGRACMGPAGGPPEQGDCETGQICLPEAFGFPNGYCTQSCASQPCPSDARCVALGGSARFCLRTCTVTAECRSGELYACQASGATGRVCLPTDGPVGMRDGGACYTTTVGPHQLPALARTTFSGANLSASFERSDSVAEAEGNVVAHPMNPVIAVPFIARSTASLFIGAARVLDHANIERIGRVADPVQPLSSDPVFAYTRDGTLRVVFLGYNQSGGTITGMHLRMADSHDDGRSWENNRAIDPPGLCTTLCDKPWIVVGPSPGDAGTESIYVAFAVQRSRSGFDLVSIRSDDGGATFTPPVNIGGVEPVSGSMITPNLVSLAVAPSGELHVVYSGLSVGAGRTGRYGSPTNRIVYRRSSDGGRTWALPRSVARTSDSPVYGQPWIALDGSSIYVSYSTGTPRGDWDVVLATSTDGGLSWRHRKVNDEPDSCATHAFASMVADPSRHVAHLLWMENRFGDGAVAYASCPQDPAMPCGANERVNDQMFTFVTSRDPGQWHGDYQGLVFTPGGDLWAAWSDTRVGTPAIYMARGRLP